MVKSRKYLRKKSSRRPRGRRAVVRKALKANWKRSVAKVCKRVIARNAEVKVYTTRQDIVPLNALATVANITSANIWRVTPGSLMTEVQINQSTSSQGRIGNEIKTHHCKLKMYLTAASYDAIINPLPQPMFVNVWCVSMKNSNSLSDLGDIVGRAGTGSFFQSGSTSTGYASNMFDVLNRANTDVLQIHFKKTYKIGHSTYYGTPGATYAGNDAQYSNNDFKNTVTASYDFTRFMSKIYKFNDLNLAPTSGKAVFLVFMITNADSSSAGNAGYKPIEGQFQLEFGFTDM